MAKQTSIFQLVGFNPAVVTFDASDTTTIKDVIVAGANDSILTSLFINSDSAVLEYIQFYLNDGSTNFPFQTFKVLAGAGTNGTTIPIDCLVNEFLPLLGGKRVLQLTQGWKLRAKATVTLSGTVNIIALASDY